MNYAEIKYKDIANGPGIRTSLFVSGCTHRCQNCFNQVTWDFGYGDPFTEEVEDAILASLEPSYVKGLTLLGGEPLEHANQIGLLPFLKRVKKTFPQKNIWCYTGYVFEPEILDKMCREWPETKEFLSYIDVLVDGRFVQELKDISLQFRGSKNQRIILVHESLQAGETLLWQDNHGC